MSLFRLNRISSFLIAPCTFHSSEFLPLQTRKYSLSDEAILIWTNFNEKLWQCFLCNLLVSTILIWDKAALHLAEQNTGSTQCRNLFLKLSFAIHINSFLINFPQNSFLIRLTFSPEPKTLYWAMFFSLGRDDLSLLSKLIEKLFTQINFPQGLFSSTLS